MSQHSVWDWVFISKWWCHQKWAGLTQASNLLAWHLTSPLWKRLQRGRSWDRYKKKKRLQRGLVECHTILGGVDWLLFSCYTIWENISLYYGRISLFLIWDDDTDLKAPSRAGSAHSSVCCNFLWARQGSKSFPWINSFITPCLWRPSSPMLQRKALVEVSASTVSRPPALAGCLSRQAKLQTGVFPYLVSHYLPLGVWVTVKLTINYAFKDLRSPLGLLFEGTKEMHELPHRHNHGVFCSVFLLLYSWKAKVLKIYFVCVCAHAHIRVQAPTCAPLQMKLQWVVNHPMRVQFQFRNLKLHMNFEKLTKVY